MGANWYVLVDMTRSCFPIYFFFFTQKTAYELRIRHWSSDVCSSDLPILHGATPEFQVGWQTRRSPSVALARPFVAFFNGFNRGFERLAPFYGQMTARLIRLTAVVLAVHVGLLGLTGWQFGGAPIGFLPEQDQGYLHNIGREACRERVCQYV